MSEQHSVVAGDVDPFREWRGRFGNYFANVNEGRGLLRFKGGIKRATIALGIALWGLTIPISVIQGMNIMRGGMAELVSLQTIVAIGGLLIAGGIIFAITTWDDFLNRVLHNFWRYSALLIILPVALWAARLAIVPNEPYMAWYLAGGGVILFLLISYMIAAKPPPEQREVEKHLDLAFAADVQRHLAWIDTELGGEVGHDNEPAIILPCFPDPREFDGTLRGRCGLDLRPRINPHGFVAFSCGSRVLSCEGAIDLTTGDAVYHRVRTFDYRDISSLALEGTGSPSMAARRTSRMDKLLRLVGRKPSAKYKTAFSIGLAGGGSIVALVYDGKSLSEMKDFDGVADNEIEPLTRWDDLRGAWQRLSKRKQEMAGRIA